MRSTAPAFRRSFMHSFLGVGLLATLGLSAPAATAIAAPEPGGAECSDGSISSARAMYGASDGRDYNSVSADQASAMEATLDRKIEQLVAAGKLDKNGDLKGNKTFTIDTYVHIITAADGSGGVSEQQVADQMEVINAGYAGTTAAGADASPFQFDLAGVDVTANDAWFDWNLTDDFSDEDDEAKDAKRALHRGGYADLNIYIAGLGGGLLGYATFPRGELALDGLVLLNESLPGGAAAPYNLGDTATHEIGHWLGLFHTFQDGCKGAGDHVPDTPAQDDGNNIFFCNDFDDTCPKKGLDPVHNFMSYGDDLCLDRFTQGQNKRQIATWLGQRARR